MIVYTYDKKNYFFDVVVNGFFSALIFLAAGVLAFNDMYRLLMLLVMGVAFYSFWNTFIARCNSEHVGVGETAISFEAFHKTEVYELQQIERLRIREFPSMGKLYIRITDEQGKQHRYWIHTKRFNEGKKLFRALLDREYQKHPETLKARARRVNTEYINEKHKQELKTNKA